MSIYSFIQLQTPLSITNPAQSPATKPSPGFSFLSGSFSAEKKLQQNNLSLCFVSLQIGTFKWFVGTRPKAEGVSAPNQGRSGRKV